MASQTPVKEFNKGLSRKVLKGLVYHDLNCNALKDENEIPLAGVKINLFKVTDSISKTGKGSKTIQDGKTIQDINSLILTEKYLSSAYTDEKGEFEFPVKTGRYSVAIDIDTLPDGLGVIKSSVLVEIKDSDNGPSGSGISNNNHYNIEFCARNVELIELSDSFLEHVYPGESFVLNAIPRDKGGKPLIAKMIFSSVSSDVEIKGNIARIKKLCSCPEQYNFKVSCGNVQRDIPITVKQFNGDNIFIINQLNLNNIIDEETKISLYMNCFINRDRISPEYWSSIPVKCGANAIKEIQDYIARKNNNKRLAEEARVFLASVIPNLDKEYTSPSGFFKIHYTTSGANAVPTERNSDIPEYIKQIGLAFDYVKDITCNIRGFRKPIIEQGKKSLDVFVYDLKGIYGITIPTKYYPATDSRQRRASCVICIDNNYSSSKGFQHKRDNCMKVTVAHEFFHAVQYAYNVDADTWWKEASATWNEDEIYNDINDYIKYMDAVFKDPEKSLDKISYGSVIFAKYLSENYGGYPIMKRIWDYQGIAYDTSIKAIDAALEYHHPGHNLGVAFKEYAASNFNPPQYYKDGHLWNKPHIKYVYHSYPAILNMGLLDHLSSSYHLFKPVYQDENATLKISVENLSQLNLAFKVQKRRRDDNLCSSIEILAGKSNKRAEIIINGFGKVYSEICLIIANLEKKADGALYRYTAELL